MSAHGTARRAAGLSPVGVLLCGIAAAAACMLLLYAPWYPTYAPGQVLEHALYGLLADHLPFALFALLVKLDSKGPAFYRQSRVGLFGQTFDVIKLRSMRTDAEQGGAQFAQENDPRVTRIGRFIRKVRIDELPQAWTVLKGEMSFVGPRPERPNFVAELEEQLPYYAERHMVKPGITGWAQINYPYGANLADSRHKLEYDLYYAKNYTPFLDLLIMLQTLRVVLWSEGAR